jgi:hypothetical protein
VEPGLGINPKSLGQISMGLFCLVICDTMKKVAPFATKVQPNTTMKVMVMVMIFRVMLEINKIGFSFCKVRTFFLKIPIYLLYYQECFFSVEKVI